MAYPGNQGYSVAYGHFSTQPPNHPAPVEQAFPHPTQHQHPQVQRTSSSCCSKLANYKRPLATTIVLLLTTGGYFLYKHFSSKDNSTTQDYNMALVSNLKSDWIDLVNLVKESNTAAGRLEVKEENGYKWATVCGESWDDNNAKVICRMLNPQCFNINLSKLRKNAYMGEGDGLIWMDKVDCIGNEDNLDQCSITKHNKENDKQCTHAQDVSVICYCDPKAVNAAVKLLTGAKSSSKISGTVRVGFQGAWGGVCDNGLNDVHAEAICQTVNPQCSTINNYAKVIKGAAFGRESSFFWIEGLSCLPGSDLAQCTIEDNPLTRCSYTQAASVHCYCTEGVEGCNQRHLSPGCSINACQKCVCQNDPYCCRTAWDQLCVNKANICCPGGNTTELLWNGQPTSATNLACGMDVQTEVLSKFPQNRKKRGAGMNGEIALAPDEFRSPILKVIGGRTTKKLGWPWLVSILKYGSHSCGGSLIKSSPYATQTDCIITARHCVVDSSSQISIIAGEFELGREEYTDIFRSSIKDIILHPEYDIAIIVLRSPVNYQTTLDPVCLPSDNTTFDFTVGHKCVIAGWGATVMSEDDPNSASKYPSVPQEAAIPIISNSVCKTQFNANQYNDKVNTEYEICAAYAEGGIDSCFGDSGGPLNCQLRSGGPWYLTGIVSRGVGCARANSPGIYTRVRKFCDWIKLIICQHSGVEGHDAIQYCDRTSPCL